jgi:hypothetical protein
MKKLLINIIVILKVSLAATLLLVFSSCSKDNPHRCEKWEVEDEVAYYFECMVTSGCHQGTLQVSLCDDDLKDARAGNKIQSTERCCVMTRTFVRMVP